jgi:anthranilate/para-aminobenzoate synthase component II
MKTLIINNHSNYIKELVSLFSDVVIIDKQTLTKDFNITNYDLIVLSGGSNVPTVLRHPEEYIYEISIIKESKIPVLGICLGAEIICEAYGGKLQELTEEHRGVITLQITNLDLEKA